MSIATLGSGPRHGSTQLGEQVMATRHSETGGSAQADCPPYQRSQPNDALADLVIPQALMGDERLWVPLEAHVWFRPLCLSASGGYWVNLLRVRRSGVLSRHRHPQAVHGYVLKGAWHYLEHEWCAMEGSYVFEPPGETHTLVVDQGVTEMITLFHVSGSMIYVDPDGSPTGYDDVFTRIAKCRAHYADIGLGADTVDAFIR